MYGSSQYGSKKQGGVVDFDVSCFADPVRRRTWLLTNALKDLTLGEALQLAQAAEDFVTKRDVAALPPHIAYTHQGSVLRH
jgi:hypothetical protein